MPEPNRNGRPNQKQKPEQNQQQQIPESGASTKQDKGKRHPSSFRKILTEHLRDDESLLSWFEFATIRKRPLVTACEADRLFVFCAAERALEHGDNPPALFADIVKNRRTDFITQAQEDRARQRLRRLRNPESCRRREGNDDEVPS